MAGIIDKIFAKKIQKSVDLQTGALKDQINSLNTKIKRSAFYSGYTGYQEWFSGRNGGAKWDYGLSSSGASRTLSHYDMRQNARDLFHDSLDARGIIERLSDTVVDTGLIPELTPIAKILGITPEQAETWASDVEAKFHLWANDKKQHRAGLMTFYQSQRLYEIQQQRDNDVFPRLYYSNKRTLQNPLQFSFIDANQIRGNAYTSTYAQFGSDDGIERNPDGTEKAYKVWVQNPSKPGKYDYFTIPSRGAKSGRLMMIHGFNPEYAGQGRGYARLGFAIQEMENLTDFTSAAIKKAINQSNFVVSVENQQKDPGQDFSSIIDPDQTALGGTTNTGTTDETADIINRLASVQYCPIPEATLGVPGSAAIVGNDQGDTIRMLGNTAPADDFKEFITTFTERLAAAVGVPQEVVLMKFGRNYSASRATLLLFWSVVEMWRQEMAADYLNPIFEAWISEEIAAGRISAPGWSDPRMRAAWLNCKWIGSPLPNIDPGKMAKATKDYLEMNLTTLERESRNLNGSDAKSNIEKNKKAYPEIVEVPWGKSGGSSNGGNI